MSFVSASKLLQENTVMLDFPVEFQRMMTKIIPGFELGSLSLIQSNNLKPIHIGIHRMMAQAMHMDIRVKLIDMANCFNPHLFPHFEHDISIHKILRNIEVSRPFQMYQCLSITNQLIKKTDTLSNERYLVIVTNITSQFLDGAQSLEGNSLLKLLEQVRHIMGSLQSLVARGHTVLVTSNNSRDENKIFNRMFSTVAKTHICIKEDESREITLLNHPYLRSRKLHIPLHKIRKKQKINTHTLSEFW